MGNIIVTVNGVKYDVNTENTTASVIGFENLSPIPSEHIQAVNVFESSVTFEGQDYPVVSINGYALYNCIILTDITIPASITNIESDAFNGCTNLSRITWENPVNFMSIGSNVFLSVNLSLVTYYNTTSSSQLPNALQSYSYPGNPQIIYNPSPYCFNKGTKILCVDKYIPIEELREGDLVKTYLHGYKKIKWIEKGHMQNNPNKWFNCMYIMKKNTDIDTNFEEKNELFEDLIVTGGHSILVQNIPNQCKKMNKLRLKQGSKTIDDLHLLLCSVSPQFKKIKDKNYYTYYHFCLENEGDDDTRYGVWANGVLTETPSVKQFLKIKGQSYKSDLKAVM